MKEYKLRRSLLFVVLLASLSLAGCGETSEIPSASTSEAAPSPAASESERPSETPTEKPSSSSDATPSVSRPSVEGITDTIYSVSERIDFANAAGEEASAEYVVQGVVKSISNYAYGERYITDVNDSSKELYVYGVRGADGTTYFDQLSDTPLVGDTVYLKGAVHTYKGTPEMGPKGTTTKLLHFDSTHTPVDESEYPSRTIAEARNAAVGTKAKVTGTIATRLLGQKNNPNGVYLVDKTGSIYIYGGAIAIRAKEGNTVTIVGEVDHFIAQKEESYANQFGYQGAIQIINATVIQNDQKTSDFPKDAIKETTRKKIVETDVKDKNITGSIYHAKAVIKKREGADYVNYYIDDLDQKTGSYVYTRNNGSDYAWLDPYVDKVSDIYFGVTNCKSTKSGCNYRLTPISASVIDNYMRTEADVPQFVNDYYASEQFRSSYAGETTLERLTSFSDSLLGIDGAKITYSSSNGQVAAFEEKDGKTFFHVKKDAADGAKTTLTITVTYKESSESFTKDITFVDVTVGSKKVSDARSAKDGDSVKVKGIVSAKILNKNAFYLTDDSGIIACQFTTSALAGWNINYGDEIVIEGTKEHYTKDAGVCLGQASLNGCTIKGITSTGNDVPRPNVITDKTFEEISKTNRLSDFTRQLYSLSVYYYTDGQNKAIIFKDEAAYSDKENGINIYKGSYSQVEFLKDRENKQITLTFALCNWNTKKYVAVCPFSATDGTKTVYNQYTTAK